MSIIRVDLAHEFMFGDDVVLLAMDGAGVTTFADALKNAVQQGQSRLTHDGVTHHFFVRNGESVVELDGASVVWKFDPAKVSEVIDNLDSLSGNNRPGHQYVDISKPADTLVLSRDEYVRQ
ncbi:hypothetical protein [Mycolicibacterium hippocampi]|jgi:hypothetical protein|uniref:Uncharacterized protein n=1 Tax=Mycolicibacterium hippocampi TaxID=659824 RepID=A0A850PP47_9MYCO|nr:hypothetical protein [Mycolicibacterium hippocampi]NVN50293.1 hypothetical protein [Mycolicibacterium hippocampi]